MPEGRTLVQYSAKCTKTKGKGDRAHSPARRGSHVLTVGASPFVVVAFQNRMCRFDILLCE